MADQITPAPLRALDANGKPVAGALLRFYLSGTSTPVTVYQDAAGTVPHPTPMVSDSKGVWGVPYEPTGASLKAVATTAGGAALPGFPIDPCVRNPLVGSGAAQVSVTATPELPYSNVQTALEGLVAQITDATRIRATDRIINGTFDIWQRGTSGTTNGYTASDRWINGNTGGTVTQSRQSHTVGDSFAVSTPQYFLRQNVTGQSLSTHFANTAQRIEDVRTYANQTITVLGWAKRSSGTGNMALEAVQSFGTGGSPSADVTGIGAAQVTLGTTWAPFAVTMTIPTIVGKTLGSNGDSFLQISFWTSAGSTFNSRTASLGIQTLAVDLWGVHVRIGEFVASDANDYRPRAAFDELTACQRYCQTGQVYGIGSATGAGNFRITSVNFQTTMRAAPSLAFSNISTSNASSGTTQKVANTGFGMFATAAASGAMTYDADFVATAEL